MWVPIGVVKCLAFSQVFLDFQRGFLKVFKVLDGYVSNFAKVFQVLDGYVLMGISWVPSKV